MKEFFRIMKKIDKPLAFVYLFYIVISVTYIIHYGVLYHGDSNSYLWSWDLISELKFDTSRTPVYPLFIGAVKLLFGENDIWIVISQSFISLFSIYYLYKFFRNVDITKNISIFLVLIYTLILLDNNRFIRTESLSINCMVYLIYFTLSSYRSTVRSTVSMLNILGLSLSMFALIFMRPAMVFIIPVYLVWWTVLILKKINVPYSLYGMGATIIICVMVGGYIGKFHDKTGVYSMTQVSTINQLYSLLEEDRLNLDIIKDDNLRNEIIDSLPSFNEKKRFRTPRGIMRNHGLVTINALIKEQYAYNPVQSIKDIWGRFTKSGYDNIYLIPDFYYSHIRMQGIYILVLCYMIILIYRIRYRKNIPLFSCLIWTLIVAKVITIVLGAPNDYARLIIPVIPLILMLLGQVIQIVKTGIQVSKFRLL